MRNIIAELLNQRRFNVMEMMNERDPVAKATIAAHIAQLDSDIAAQAKAEADRAIIGGTFEQYEALRDADIAADELEERTQVIPVCSMADLVWGGNS